MMWGKRNQKGRKGKPGRKANRRLTPEEQLLRNVSTPTAKPRKARTSKGHVKPLEPGGTQGGKRTRKTQRPNRIGSAFMRAFAPIRHSLTGEWLGGPEVLRHLPFAAFLGFLFIGYIYLQYRYEYDERAIKEGRKELRNLRHHEQALRGRFESQLQRSRLDEAMADVNLAAPDTPPLILPEQDTP